MVNQHPAHVLTAERRLVGSTLTPSAEQHLRAILEESIEWADVEGVVAAARALLPHLGAHGCSRLEADCRPGACDCDGAHDALVAAISAWEAAAPETVGKRRSVQL